jgi:hypothetical protein
MSLKRGGGNDPRVDCIAVVARCFACALQQNQHFASQSDENHDDFHVIPKVKANVAMS